MKKKKLSFIIPLILGLSSCEIKFELNLSSLFSSSEESISSSFNSSSFFYNEGEFDPLSIHFLELGNKYTGDSVYIKAGENDILIDAGSRKDSAPTLSSYIDKYCLDKKLEFVIATHAHQDHLAGFIGSNDLGIFSQYEIDTLIDFPKADSSSQIYKSYLEERETLIINGTKHYTALDCYNNINGASRNYSLGKGITLNILYQKFYEQKASGENNYSVCVLLSQGENNHFLFTGDLEKEGEESLVLSISLPHVKVFKGGHHGSGTSNTDTLLNKITPENVCICTCAGTPEYTTTKNNQFPYQEVINRYAAHTENIYVTSQIDEEKSTGSTYYTKPMNGNIVVTSSIYEFSIHGSNNDLKLKDTEWFKKNRVWPSIII